jgi:hypothetical protein
MADKKSAVADMTSVDVSLRIKDAKDVAKEKLIPNAILATVEAQTLSDGKTGYAPLSAREARKVGNTPTLNREIGTIPPAMLKRIRTAYEISSPAMRKEIEAGLREYFSDNIDDEKGPVRIMPEAFAKMDRDAGMSSTILYAETEAAKAARAKTAAAPAMTAADEANYRKGAHLLYGEFGVSLKAVKVTEDDVYNYISESGINRRSEFLKSLNGDARNMQNLPEVTARTKAVAAPAKTAAKAPVPTKVVVFEEATMVRAGGAAGAYREDERAMMHLAAAIGENISVGGKTFYYDIYKDFAIKRLGKDNWEKLGSAFKEEADRKTLFEFLYLNGSGAGAYEKLKVILNDKEPVKSLRDTVALYAKRGTTAQKMLADATYNKGAARYGTEYLAGEAEPVAAKRAISTEEVVPAMMVKGARLNGKRITVDFAEAFGEGKSVLQKMMPWSMPNASTLTLQLDSMPSAMRQSELLSSETSRVYEVAMDSRNTLYVDVRAKDPLRRNVDVTVTLRSKSKDAKPTIKRASFTVGPDGIADGGKASQVVNAGLGVTFLTVENSGKKTVQVTSKSEAMKAVAAAPKAVDKREKKAPAKEAADRW